MMGGLLTNSGCTGIISEADAVTGSRSVSLLQTTQLMKTHHAHSYFSS